MNKTKIIQNKPFKMDIIAIGTGIGQVLAVRLA
jgi:hypothetical protein